MRRNRRLRDNAMTSSRICPRPPHPPRPSRAAPCRRACRRARPSGCASMRCMRISSAHVHAADTSFPELTARSSLGDDHRTRCRYITEASMPGREQHVGSIVGPQSRSVDPAALSWKARPTPCATQPAARRGAPQGERLAVVFGHEHRDAARAEGEAACQEGARDSARRRRRRR
jgi:hypothetical protein